MKLVTSAQMQALDGSAILDYSVPSLDLMERAGLSVADFIIKKFPKKGIVAIVAGKGNNGGDGLVTARYLKSAGFEIELFLLSSWTDFTPDSRVNWDRLAGLNILAYEITNDASIKEYADKFRHAVCVVDAIFGTGLSQEVRGKYKTVIEFLNSLLKPIVAVDVPSGLSADTGQAQGVAIRARYTVTFGLGKVGLFTSQGAEYAREVVVIDIGFPKELIEKTKTGFALITDEMIAVEMGPRRASSHKGDFGHVLVLAGSNGKMGAGLLASRAALRSGAGLVTYALPKLAFAKFDTKNPEIMYEALEDKGLGYLNKNSLANIKSVISGKDVLAIGPGLGTHDDTREVLMEVIKRATVPMVIDADGLNLIAGHLAVISRRKASIVLTPHPGEMARLTGKNIKDIQNDRIKFARDLSCEYSVYVVLKGHRTVIATPAGNIYINPTGNPGMATAGMGDVLTGVISALIAQKMPVESAIVCAVYLHGMAADLAARDIGERGLIASDVIACLPKAIKALSCSS